MDTKEPVENQINEITNGNSQVSTQDSVTENNSNANILLLMNQNNPQQETTDSIQTNQTYISEPMAVTITDAHILPRPMTVEEFQQKSNNPQESEEPQVFTRPMTMQEYQEATNEIQDRSLTANDLHGTKCLVCEDRASGFHYSVFSCEGCKGFFKRTVQKALTYVCREQGNCVINKFTRNSCQHCRYNKCVAQGMRKEAVREDRSPGGKHRLKRPRLEEIPGTLDAKDEIYDSMIETLVNAQPDIFPKSEKNFGGNIGVNDLMQYGYLELKFIIEWAKKVPGFQEMSMDDQMCLLKSAFMELNVLRLAYRSMNLDRCIKFAEGVVIPTDVAQGMGWGRELVNATIEFTSRLRELKIDRTEFAILNALVLTFPDAIGIQDKLQVLGLQTKILDALRRYTSRNYPTETRRYGKILLRLPALRTVSAKAAEKFLSLTLDGSIQLNDLVFEMIT